MIDIDYQSRDRIVSDVSHNFFVEAGAGSGKTTVLVKRMVAMVESGIDVGRICAITFTKAAAGEFYDRFQKILSQRANAVSDENAEHRHGDLPAPTDLSRERCAEALRNIDLCFMGTIDSFCNTVLGEHPAKAKIPSNASVRSADEMEKLYKREYARITRGEYGTVLQDKCRRFRSFNKYADGVFVSSLKELMKIRHSDIVFDRAPTQSVNDYLADKIDVLKEILTAIKSNPSVILASNDSTRKAKQVIDNKMNLLLGNWEHSLPDVIEALKNLEGLKICCEPQKIGIHCTECFFPSYAGKNKVIDGYVLNPENEKYPYRELKEYQYSVTMEFLCECTELIAVELRKTGDLTFNDYLFYLRDMLKEDAINGGKLISHIFERHSYFLIDEFQDTNPVQAEVFFYLTAREPKEEWSECIPKPGSLFIVGDPKQSIYRFREADVSSFLKVKELFCKEVGEVLYLRRNFRSTYGIREWFNRVFTRMLPEKTENQSKYDEIPLGNETDDGTTFNGVYTYTCCSKNDMSLRDEKRVTNIILNLVGNPIYTVKGGDDKEPRQIQYDDFMLITPGKDALPKYMREFTSHKIPFMVEGNVEFEGCPALSAVSTVFSAIAYPNDFMPLYAALTSDIFGVDSKRIYALKNAGYPLRIYREEENNTDTEVGAILDALKSIVFRSKEMSSSVLFSVLLEELHILEKVGTLNLEYLYYSLELLRVAEVKGSVSSLQSGADFLEGLLSGKSEIERSISLKPDGNRVHIANLHKVKGLEAQIVILAGRTTTKRIPERRTERGTGKPVSYVFSLPKSVTTEKYPDVKQNEVASLEAECNRLLYVAETRAKRALIIGCVLTSKGEIYANNMWEKFFPYVKHDFYKTFAVSMMPESPLPQTVTAADLRSLSEAANISKTSTSREKSYVICRPSMLKLKNIISSDDDYEDGEDEETRSNLVRKNAALVGTMVHRLMELLVTSHKTDLGCLILDIVREYDSGDEKFVVLLKEVGEKIGNGGYEQTNNVPRDILGELLSADEVHCEVPFCYREEADGIPKIWNGVMDVLYCKDNKWHIVDYKTNAEADDLDEKYEEQLNAYIRAFRQMTGNNADALIYHINV